jgi:hypothetical protein
MRISNKEQGISNVEGKCNTGFKCGIEVKCISMRWVNIGLKCILMSVFLKLNY